MSPELKAKVLRAASEPYRPTGRFNFHWAHGKLGADPVFAALTDHAVFAPGARVFDLGCGRGLLAAWLLASEQVAREGGWTSAVAAPAGLEFVGVDIVASDIACARRALAGHPAQRVRFETGDMCDVALDGADAVAMLDALHYVPYARQDAILDRIRSALRPGGVFVARIGDAAGGLRFHWSQLVDRWIFRSRGHRLPRTWCRTAADWVATIESRGYHVEAVPMSQGTSFSNVLLVARLPRPRG